LKKGGYGGTKTEWGAGEGGRRKKRTSAPAIKVTKRKKVSKKKKTWPGGEEQNKVWVGRWWGRGGGVKVDCLGSTEGKGGSF